MTENGAAREFEKKANPAGGCTQLAQTDAELYTGETHHSLPHNPTGQGAGGQAAGILAGVDLTPFDPLPGSDGRIKCALIWCPEVPRGTRFALIRKDNNGGAEKLEDGVLVDEAPSLNLARLRQRGAQLGANEVVLILPQACASLG